ncbi:glycosyltransferase family 2 protein [Cribrihabitans sp. XS_ASV171]
MSIMKICALTMVYRDYWALAQWYRHYSRHLGEENLFIVSHGADPEIARICPSASIITVPRDDLEHFDRRRTEMLNGFQLGLANIYDWVIRTDADELICLNPHLHSGFPDLFSKHQTSALFALGLNVAEGEEDPPCGPDEPVLLTRKAAVFTPNYSKAFAVRGRAGLKLHGVQLRPRHVKRFALVMPRGVYMAHLKYANTQALSDSYSHRREMATIEGKGLPGPAWANPGADSRRFFQQLLALPERPWEEAEAEAYALYPSDPIREPERGVVRIRRDQPKIRTRLPDWFRSA